MVKVRVALFLFYLFYVRMCKLYLVIKDPNQAYPENYSFVQNSPEQYILAAHKKSTNKSLCDVIPEFDKSDWRTFREQSRYEYVFPNGDNNIESADEHDQVALLREELSKAGFKHQSSWSPVECEAVHNITIIVPYKNRISNLKKFIVYIHPFLKLQKVAYRIVVVEQGDHGKFNKGTAFNAGFVEMYKRWPSPCYFFHDVDMIPENLKNIYGCTKYPRHLTTAINSWRYLFHYSGCVGGVLAMTREQFQMINGYSNAYKGWGAEDDDLSQRLSFHRLPVMRFDYATGGYLMLAHTKGTTSGGDNSKIYSQAKSRFKVDGLNNLVYTLLSIKDGIGFTHVRIVPYSTDRRRMEIK